MNRNEELREEFEALVRPMIKFINDNYHPHARVIINTNSAVITSDELGIQTDEFIKD